MSDKDESRIFQLISRKMPSFSFIYSHLSTLACIFFFPFSLKGKKKRLTQNSGSTSTAGSALSFNFELIGPMPSSLRSKQMATNSII